MQIYEWGVDSAENVTDNLFQCVVHNLGYPVFWGRYLVRVPRVSEGLTKQEILFIHSKGVKLLLIYNSIQSPMGYGRGYAAAIDAVLSAQILGVSKGVPLFANIERSFQIDAEWIQGWTEAIVMSGYRSGIYNDPVTGDFNKAFCAAVRENEKIKALNILWSAEPEMEPSGPRNPLVYSPTAPDCGGNVWAWQYSRRVTSCPVDTDLVSYELYNLLW